MKKYFVSYIFANCEAIAKSMFNGKKPEGTKASAIIELNPDAVTMQEVEDLCREHLKEQTKKGLSLLTDDNAPGFLKNILRDQLTEERQVNALMGIEQITPL